MQKAAHADRLRPNFRSERFLSLRARSASAPSAAVLDMRIETKLSRAA
jgi:hypothetical protein